VSVLLVSQQQLEQGRKRARIERAKAMVAMGMQPQDQAQRRGAIPDDVQQLVWLRDGGAASTAAPRQSSSSTTSSRSRWVEAAILRTFRSCADPATGARVPA
jgi:hypothetical protein